MDKESVKGAVEALYRARLANDVEGCLCSMGPGASLRIAGSAQASPIPLDVSGEEPLRQVYSQLVAMWKWQRQEILSITVEGDRAVVHFRLHAVFAPTGAPVESELVDIITVRDGKIASVVEFVDTALVARMAQGG